jgi:pre-mRNA-processing factor 19
MYCASEWCGRRAPRAANLPVSILTTPPSLPPSLPPSSLAVSGQPPKNPVVSLKSGHLFDRSIVEKYISVERKCPVTGSPLSKDDLVDVVAESATRPRPVDGASVPGLLTHLQNEWDEAMLEMFTLKKHLDQTRQELSQSLYQQDAACRVIARLMRERDEARSQLQMQRTALAQASASSAVESSGMDVDSAPPPAAAAAAEPKKLPETVISEITAKWKELSKTRKKRQLPAELATTDTIGSWEEKSNVTLHKTKPAGITCLAMQADGRRAATGGNDKTVIVYDVGENRQEGVLSGHSKKVTDVGMAGDVVVSSSADCTACVWRGGEEVHSFAELHSKAVTAVALHPLHDYLATAGEDSSWSVCDIGTGTVLASRQQGDGEAGFTCGRWHPDGIIFCVGTSDCKVRVWDCKSMESAAVFEAHEKAISCLAFSENGYHMASGGEDQTVHLWDLRKMKSVKNYRAEAPITSIAFDGSGTYLAVGSTRVETLVVKEWTPVGEGLGGFQKGVTGLAFGPNAQSLFATSLDRTLRSFS